MLGSKEARGFLQVLLIFGILVIVASVYSTVWAAPAQTVSGQTPPTLPTATPTLPAATATPTSTPPTPTYTPTPTRTPRPTTTITPMPTVTPTPTAVPVITPPPTVVAPVTATEVDFDLNAPGDLGKVVTNTDGSETLVTTEMHLSVGGDVGDVSASISVDLKSGGSTSGNVHYAVSKEPFDEIYDSYSLAATDAGTKIKDIAYVLTVEHVGLENGTDLGEARITMKAPVSWVDAQGGVGNVKIFRWDAASQTRQVLETRVIGRVGSTIIFEGISPNGLSVFALVALEAAPPVAVPTGGAIKAFTPGVSTTLSSPDGKVTVIIPSTAPVGSGYIMYEPKTSADSPKALGSGLAFGSAIFQLNVLDLTGAVDTGARFWRPITVEIKYSDEDVAAAEGNPTRLTVYKYDTVLQAWTPLTTSADMVNKTVKAQVTRTSLFALVGQAQPPAPTPTPTPTLRPGVATPTATAVPPPAGDVAPGSGLLVGLLIAAVVLMGAGGYYLRQGKRT